MSATLAVLDWRRRVAELYAPVRAAGDPEQAHAAWRAGRQELLAHHPASPVPAAERADFAGVTYGAYDPAFRFEVPVAADRDEGRDTDADGDGADEPDRDPVRWDVATGTDGIVAFTKLGVVRLPGLGDLDVWRLGSYGGGVFLPVKDASAGRRTYGGGRYLLDTVKGADLGGDALAGRLVVDLNFAYAPSCAYDPAWACPLAPPGNTLEVAVEVGELVG